MSKRGSDTSLNGHTLKRTPSLGRRFEPRVLSGSLTPPKGHRFTQLTWDIHRNFGDNVMPLVQGLDINEEDKQGQTPLVMAAEKRHNIFLYLLGCQGINVNKTAGNNLTALYVLSREGKEKLVKKLMDNRASVDIPSTDLKQIPLHIAAGKGHTAVVKELLKRDSNLQINKPDIHGWTPLMWAAFSNTVEIVRMLLLFKADISLKSSQSFQPDVFSPLFEANMTALDIARQRGHRDIQELLEREQYVRELGSSDMSSQRLEDFLFRDEERGIQEQKRAVMEDRVDADYPWLLNLRVRIGREGEKYVFEYLCKKYKEKNNIVDFKEDGQSCWMRRKDGTTKEVRWINADKESYKPYDLEITIKDQNGKLIRTLYIEVKSSSNSNRVRAYFSEEEWKLMENNAQAATYIVYFVSGCKPGSERRIQKFRPFNPGVDGNPSSVKNIRVVNCGFSSNSDGRERKAELPVEEDSAHYQRKIEVAERHSVRTEHRANISRQRERAGYHSRTDEADEQMDKQIAKDDKEGLSVLRQRFVHRVHSLVDEEKYQFKMIRSKATNIRVQFIDDKERNSDTVLKNLRELSDMLKEAAKKEGIEEKAFALDQSGNGYVLDITSSDSGIINKIADILDEAGMKHASPLQCLSIFSVSRSSSGKPEEISMTCRLQ